jgi:hypothetical protein
MKNSIEIMPVDNITGVNFSIPPYQRPYKWTPQHALQLLDDIFEHVVINNKNYRIGNVILHENKNTGEKDVVDGQQRLTTLSLILKMTDSSFKGLLLQKEFKHKISNDNIVHNARAINNWLKTKFGNDEKKKEFFNQKILEKCEFVIFTVHEHDEAFQLFDSQNTRGKDLEPHDLLKAFHLREMASDTEVERAKCVERWEKSIDENKLKPILGNHLFRIRKWSKNEWKYNFTKSDIDEFKGISLHQSQKYPYENALRMLDGFVDNAQHDKFLRNLHIAQSFPFSITMPVINGKRFFEYVDFYIQEKDRIFDKEKHPALYDFYNHYCWEYPGAWRSGDEKVRNLYENILIAFLDKFGFIENFEGYYQAFYKAAYVVRCNKKRISLETVLRSDVRQNIFRNINDAVSPENLKKYQYKTYEITDPNNTVNGIDNIITFIKNGK